ncbi:MAG: MFS transporter [Candidatus Bathyarchaeota archaeon]|nr:MFS transporter [Candidatus Bathyarchaeota archaeon]
MDEGAITPKPFPYVVVAMVWLGWVSIIFSRMIIPPLLPLIEEDLGISHAQAGLLMSSYFLAYALMQLPAGMLGDRLGVKRMMTLGIFGMSAVSLLLWFARSLQHFVILRLLLGLFSGFWYAPGVALVTSSASDRDRGKAIGLTFTAGSVSNLLIFAVVGVLLERGVGWRSFLLICAVQGFLSTALLFSLLKEAGRGGHRVNTDRWRLGALKKIARRSSVLGVLAFRFVTSLGGGSLFTFLPTYLVLEKQLTLSGASFNMLIYSAAGMFGNVIGGYLTDALGHRPPIVVSTVAICASVAALPSTPPGLPMVLLLLAWGVLGSFASSALQVFLAGSIPLEVRGTFFGLENGVGFIGTAIGPVLLGFVADALGFNALLQATLALFILGVVVAIAMIR